MRSGLRSAVEAAVGSRVERASPVAGGDINDAFEARLADGRAVFVKANDAADPSMFAAEARGLSWLAEAAALRVPRVLAVSSNSSGPRFLVLEHLGAGAPCADLDERTGRGLAHLHRYGAPSFGLDHDNFLGRLPQINAPLDEGDDWASFYAWRRLEPMLRAADDRGLVDRSLRRGFEALFARLPDLVGPPEQPARLHGDLWGGNLHVDGTGAPCLVDPAVYGGHREVDLSMMRLFGGFGARCFAAYEEAWPLAAGAADRVPLHQLYPLLAHVNLFGAGYVGSVRRALGRYVML